MGALAKMPVNAELAVLVREATRLGQWGRASIRVTRDPRAESYSDAAIAEVTIRHFDGNGATVSVDIPARIGRGHDDETAMVASSYGPPREQYSGVHAPTWGFEVLSWALFTSAVYSLPRSATVNLEIMLDAHTTETMVPARLHGDAIYLSAAWGEGARREERRFLVAVSIVLHNSARFGVSRHY